MSTGVETPSTGIQNHVAKLSLITSLLLIPVSSAIPRLNEYAASIYWQVPAHIWAILFGTTILSIFSSLALVLIGRNKSAIYALLPVITTAALFPYIPHLLGYIVKFSDEMNHVGSIRHILRSGTLPSIIYPAEHISSAMIIQITGLPHPILLAILSTLAVILLSLTTLLLARTIDIPAATAVVLVPVGATLSSNTPATFTWSALFPFFIYIILRLSKSVGQTKKWRIATIGLLLYTSIWVWHVVPAIISTGLLVVAIFTETPQLSFRNKTIHILGPIVLVSGLIGYLWMNSTALLRRLSLMLYAYLRPRNLPTSSLETGSLFNVLFGEFGLSLSDVVVVGLLQFGGVIFLSLGSGLGVVLFYHKLLSKRNYVEYEIPHFLSVLIVSCGVWSVLEAGIGVISALNFHRVLKPVLHGGLIVVGSSIYVGLSISRSRILKPVKKTHMVLGILIILLVITPTTSAVLLSYNSTYESPDKLQANRYILPSDLHGMDWYFNMKSRDVKTTTLWRYNWRYVNYLLPQDEQKQRREELDGGALDRGYRAPEHFGYTNNSSFFKTVGCRYYIEGEYDKATYLQARPSSKFTSSDFTQLDADASVSKIYANGNFELSKVGGC